MKAFALMAIALNFLSCASTERNALMAADGAAAPDLESMTYLSAWFPSGRVKLSHGEFREAAAPGSASGLVVKLGEKRAFGVVHGKETGAVILLTDAGGTGTFYDLALLSEGEKGWVNTDVVLLGDRVRVLSVEITDDGIDLTMMTHGAGDPVCCPTLQMKKRFRVQESRLLPIAARAADGQAEIAGPVWQWISTLYNDGRKIVPPGPKGYTVQFLEEGRLNAKADCNLKGGTYSLQDSRLSIQITHSTMAACPEGSLEDQFVRDLTAAVGYFLKDGDLYIDLKFDSGTMKFQRDKGEVL